MRPAAPETQTSITPEAYSGGRSVGRVRLILVRHGRSTWNAEGRLQGIADPPLSPAGAEQSRRLRGLIEALAPEEAVSSDLERARGTAELLVGPGTSLDPRWREMDLGDWTGRLMSEMSAVEQAELERWRQGGAAPPGGETWEGARIRLLGAIRSLLDTGARSALVITHGATIRATCATLGSLGLPHLARVPNASLTIIDTEPQPHLLAYGVAPPDPAGNGISRPRR